MCFCLFRLVISQFSSNATGKSYKRKHIPIVKNEIRVSLKIFSSVQFSRSVMADSLQPHGLCISGFPVYHQLPEFTQTHVHLVGDAIQPSHPLSSPSSPAFNLSQHQGLFQRVSSLHQVAKVL